MQNNIKEIRKKNKLTARELADLIGCSESLVFKLENGQRSITLDWIPRLCEALGVPPEELSYDENYYFNNSKGFGGFLKEFNKNYFKQHLLVKMIDIADEDKVDIDELMETTTKTDYVPVIDWISLTSYFNEDIGKINILGVLNYVDKDREKYFGLPVIDNSMAPRFLEGDIIIVNPEEREIKNGEYCLAEVGQGEEPVYTFRQYEKDGKYTLLKSLNPSFPSLAYLNDNRDSWTLLGKIVDIRANI